MATAPSDVKKRGYLYKLPVSGGVIKVKLIIMSVANHFYLINPFLKVWSKRWAVLRSTSHDGVVRLEYYDKEENEIKGENRRVIILRNSTGCCETSDYKRTKPHAFQFSSSIGRYTRQQTLAPLILLYLPCTHAGHHVFSTDSQTDLDDWIDSINDAIQQDKRLQKKKSKSKTKMAEAARSITTLHSTERNSSASSIGSTGSNVPHPTTLMGKQIKKLKQNKDVFMLLQYHYFFIGVYQVVIDDNDFSSQLGARGNCQMNIGPRGLKLVSDATGSTIGTWHYRRIRSYSKSANRQVLLEIGSTKGGSPGGQLVLSSGSSKEMFSMIHRNIKLLRGMREKALAEKERSEAAEVREKVKTKQQQQQQDQSKRSSLISRPRSMAYELQQGDQNKRISYPSFAEQQTVGSDLIQLQGFTDGLEDDEDFQQFLDSLDPLMQPVLESVNELTSEVYDSPSNCLPPPPPPPRPTQSNSTNPFVGPQGQHSPDNASNPFVNVDPFNTSPQGSFYNSKEDIFENFDSGGGGESVRKTSTPSKSVSNNPFLASGVTPEARAGSKNPFAMANTSLENELKELENPEEYTYAKPVKPAKKMSQEEFDKVWEDITADLHLPPN